MLNMWIDSEFVGSYHQTNKWDEGQECLFLLTPSFARAEDPVRGPFCPFSPLFCALESFPIPRE